ncbi:hypothetical protein [Paenibacillus lemnae]|uniref:Uncharacterized protein n=1 Tax=Paenibacillus lemnae TaxID=1330551 RepID=A0A848M236_PAELE|nr:hypothetical protein [Paenibacillus lemnae]NMO95038.1 hypothetical protein [Paenibacillus lemnae]
MKINRKYVSGMNRIQAEKELKDRVITLARSDSGTPSEGYLENIHPVRRRRLRTAAMISAALLFVVMTFALVDNQNGQEQGGLIPSLAITAYAADGMPIEVKPNVDFPLGQYSPTMSSVPGLPLTITAEDADQIELTASGGKFVLWNTTDYKVREQGRTVSVSSGDKVYWSPPLSRHEKQHVLYTINVDVYLNKEKVGTRIIEITKKDDNKLMYTGRLAAD